MKPQAGKILELAHARHHRMTEPRTLSLFGPSAGRIRNKLCATKLTWRRTSCAAVLLCEVQHVTRPEEAGDAGPNQQRPGRAFGLVFPGGELRRA